MQKLTLPQGAVLAGVVQNPSRFDLKDREKRAAVVTRRATVLQRMRALGFITEATRYNASRAPIKLNIKTVGSGCEDKAVGSAAFFCAYVRQELENTDLGKALGETREERQTKLLGGGLVIKTTLDRTVQRAAQEGVDGRVPQDDASGARAVADVVEPGTGHIKAMAVNIPYGEGKGQSKVNFAVGGSFGFQAGSTFKAFVLATALKQGIPLSLTLYSPSEYESKEFINYVDGRKIPYKIKNSEDSEDGTFDMLQATHLSVNTYYLQLLERTKVEEPAALAESLGVRRVRDPAGKLNTPLDRGANFVLGGSEVSPLAMAGAYAAFAAHGTFCRPQAVLSITDSRGKPVEVPKPSCKQVMQPEIAGAVNQVLRGVVDGPNPKTGGGASLGRPAAGKTGTTNESRAAWFIGYTPQLSTAVWVGKPDPTTGAPTSMRRTVIGDRYYRQVYGGTIPAAIFRATMREALRGQPVRDFDDVELPAVQGETAEVPDLRGLSIEQASQRLAEAGFGVVVGDTVPATYVPRGTVAYSSPRRNTQARQGETVTLFIAGRNRRAASDSAPGQPATAQPALQRNDPAPAQTAQA
ncbi:MAG: glycosyl transferase, family 51, partial [Frankiales bacterium]|nr:glycosyl transferase, family 51 [Frankiales bacterium]